MQHILLTLGIALDVGQGRFQTLRLFYSHWARKDTYNVHFNSTCQL